MSGATFTQPDLTLLLDLDGVIRQATLSAAVADETLADWVGRPWVETVDGQAGDKVRRIVEDARRSGVSAFRQINQRFPSGRELPMEFTTVRLGGREGLIAIGRNLQAVSELQSRLIAAQQAREQDYWKLREVETRYRLLFDATHEPVLVLAVDGFRVLEANPAAIRAFGFAPGWEFLADVAPQDVDQFRAVLARAREHGRTPGIMLRLGPGRAPWVVRASLMVSAAGPVFLLQLTPASAAPVEAAGFPAVSVEALIDRLPDAFVAIEPGGTVRRANGAFLDLVQMPSETAVTGESLGRWLGAPGADLMALLAAVRRHGLVRLFSTRINGELGGEAQVEVSAAGNSEAAPRLIGMLIRDVGRRMPSGSEGGPLAGVLGGLAGQVGQMPLLQLVRETTVALERHYIEAALTLAAGNRTAAAELLGLSRQSLYVKLNRYGLDAATAAAAADGD